MKNTLLTTLLIVIAGGAGFALQHYLSSKQDTAPESPAINGVAAARIGDHRPEFAITDLEGKMRSIKEWDGRVVLLNFWATWCPPCLKEIPMFMDVYRDYHDKNFDIVGIAVDNDAAVKEFVDNMSVEYPVMAGDVGAIELARRYGNKSGALPFSAVIDKNGKITHMITGELEKEQLLAIMKSLGIRG